MYFCYNNNGRILVDWSSETVGFVNKTLYAIACSYICSYIFYVLTVLWPKAERTVPIMDITKVDMRFAKDIIGGFFMENGGRNDVNSMTIDEVKYCIIGKTNAPLVNSHGMYSIVGKETEWIVLLNQVDQVKGYFQFIQTVPEYLTIENLNRIKVIKVNWHVSHTILSNHIINYERLGKDIDDVTEIEKIRKQILSINNDDLLRLAENIKKMYYNIEDLYSHL